MDKRHLWISCCSLLAAAAAAQAGSVPSRVALVAEPFDLREVHLLDSPFKKAQQINRQLLVEMDFDRLLHPFRLVAGIPSPLKIKYDANYSMTGHTAGHYLSACALHYRNTGDVEVKQKADAVVAEMARCQEKLGTGFLGGFPEATMGGVPWYCLHKIYAGLLDMYLLADNEQARDILMKVAAWADGYTGKMTDAAMQGMLQTEHGGICEFWSNLYAATGDARCLKLAERFVQRAYVDSFARGEGRLERCHANTQIPKFSSVARLYQLTGNPTNQLSAVNFWRAVTESWSYVTGGNSYSEYFQTNISYYIGTRNSESCNEYNMLKLGRYLFNTEPLAEYADYHERTLYNHVLSSKNPRTGGQLYFQSLQSGNLKGDATRRQFVPYLGWRFLFNKPSAETPFPGCEGSCCSGSGLESNAKYADSIYFHGADKDLYVNLFIPSVLDWKANGLTVRQETRYPEQGATKLLFACRKPMVLKLHLRRPWWATGDFQVLINGQHQEIAAKPGSYVVIERTWQDGDRVEVLMPMGLRMEGFKDNPKRAAVMYGPLVMAAEAEYGNPFSVIVAGDERFLETLKPVEGKPLEFAAPPDVFRNSPVGVADKPVVLRPLFQTLENPYAVYWDIMSPETFQKEAAVVQAELQRHKDMEPRTVDMVLCYQKRDESFSFQSQLLAQPGWLARDPKSVTEEAHGMKRKDGRRRSISWLVSEMFFGYKGDFCLLEPETSRSYQMKVLPDKEQTVEVLIWKSRFNENNVLLKQGTLEVVVEGQVLGKCDAATIPAGQFTQASFAIPAELIKGKEKVEVMLRVPAKSEAVSGIQECRIVTNARN
jgi:DUF1680 family protein